MWAAAQVHSYDVSFYVAAGFILVAGLGSAPIYPSGWHPDFVREEVAVPV